MNLAVCEIDDDGRASRPHPVDFPSQGEDLQPGDVRVVHASAVRGVMLEIMRRDTGDCADPAKRTAAAERRAELLALTVDTANDLEAGGISCYRRDESEIWIQGLHSGLIEKPVRFAHKMILAAVAARARQPMLAAAGFFLQSRLFARTAVFTSGPRTKLRDVGACVRELNRDLSRLNYGLRKKWGVEIVLRSDELGTPENDEAGAREDAGEIRRDLDGEPTFHVHAHVIFHLMNGKPMPAEAWDGMLRWVGANWPAWWQDCGVLRDAAEVVKYITKPREIAKLTPAEKCELSRQLSGLKLLQPMGALRREIASRRERRMTLDRHPTPDGRVFREVHDWNRHPAKRPVDAATIALEAVVCHSGDPFRVKDHERPTAGAAFAGVRVELEPEPRCAAILVPGFMPGSNVREPRAVFFGRRIDATAPRRDPRCVLVVEATRDEWLAGLAAAAASGIRVHTCTPTVGGSQAPFAAEIVSETCPATTGPPTPAG